MSKTIQQFINQMATELGNSTAFENRNVEIERKGTKIILPADPREMTEDEGIEALERIKKQNTTKVAISEEIDAFPLEGAWALRKVLEKMFGYVLTGDVIETMFGTIPGATMRTLEVGPGKFDQILWGNFEVPGVKGELTTAAVRKDGRFIFAIRGEVLQGNRDLIKAIAQNVREYVKANSLYKGQAVKVTTMQDETGKFHVDFNNPPKFIDLSRVNEAELVFSNDVQSLIQTNLFTPIERTEECRKYQVPLKRAVLLEGPYGTGKTLTAFATAKKAVQNKWTFMYMDRPQALHEVLVFARRYAPVVIFCEDIERVVSGGRSTEVDDVLNNIDGIDSKGHEVICIFTTNHVEQIERAMLRAGRLDAVISVLPPDAEAAQKLVRVYARDLVAKKTDLSAAGKELAGQIPAFIREVVERAKLFAIGHMEPGKQLKLNGEDLRIAAVGMKRHFELVNPPSKPVMTAGDKLGLALTEILGSECVRDGANEYADEEALTRHRNTLAAESRPVQ